MKNGRALIILSLLAGAVFVGNGLSEGKGVKDDSGGTRIFYGVRPFGKVEIRDMGVVDFEGQRLNLLVMRIKVFMLEDAEKIFIDPESFLVRRIERHVTKLFGRDFYIEEYDQKKFVVMIKHFRKGRLVREREVQKTAPVHNALLLPYYLSRCIVPDLTLTWDFTERGLGAYKMELVGTEAIRVPAGTFLAYHYKSIPAKFDIWINKSDPRVPLRLRGKGGLDYTFLMTRIKELGMIRPRVCAETS